MKKSRSSKWKKFRHLMQFAFIAQVSIACSPIAGNSSVDLNFAPGVNNAVISTTTPVPPSIEIQSPVTGSYVNSSSDSAIYAVSGTCNEASRTVTIMVDGVIAGTASCNGTSFSGTIDTTALSEAAHAITASISDTAGNSATSTSISVTRDVSPPTLAISSPVAGGYVNSSNDSATYTVSGSCSESSRTVTIKVDGVSAGTASCMGTIFSGAIDTTTLSEASHVITAMISDLAGNATSSTSVSITRDVSAPTLEISSPVTDGYINSSSDSATYAVSGSCSESSRTVTIKIDGMSAGLASCTGTLFSGSIDTTSLSEGVHLFTASISDTAGNSATSAGVSVIRDVSVPTISSVSTVNVTGTYTTGTLIVITINLNQNVTVLGTPTITLNTNNSRTANYVSGTGTSRIVFNYTVQAGDSSSRLNYASTSSLALNGGSIADDSGNSATLTLPTLTIAANGFYSANILIDAVAPVVTSVDTTFGPGTYSIYFDGAETYMEIDVTFSKAVTVTGTPKLDLNILPSKTISYAYGSGTNTLRFGYTVVNGDHSPTTSTWMNYSGTNALSLNGGTIRDSIGNNANLVLASPSSSALYSKNIIIDTIAPVKPTNLSWGVSSMYDIVSTNANWTVSSSGDLSSQVIQIYSNSSCSTYLSAANIYSNTQNAFSFTPPTYGSNYTYNIISYDVAGNTSTSDCSSVLNVPKIVSGKSNALSVQGSTVCAVINGSAQCWGKAQYGALGNGDAATSKNTAQQVTGLTSGVQAVAAGYYHACALVNGGVKCWGNNTYGQLGDGTTTNRSTPVSVSGLTSGVQAIAAGLYFTCALTGGSVKCWGRNDFGQIGNSTVAVSSTSVQLTPITVSAPLTNMVQDIKAFGSNACALANAKVYCWGNNLYGQLGNNTSGAGTDSNIPVQVKNSAGTGFLDFVHSISVGNHHACVLINGGVQCWGRNTYYQLGDGTNTARSLPVSVSGYTSSVQQVSTGALHTCVIVDGVTKCWGYNASGQVGDNTITTKTTPTSVLNSSNSTFTGSQYVSAGVDQTCAIVNGSIRCWGSNTYGQIGDGTNTDRLVATQSSGLTSGILEASIGPYHGCAIINGGVQCWGRNDFGQLGNGTIVNSSSPVIAIAANSGVQGVAVGDYHTCAIVNGAVRCWGRNDKNQITATSTAYFNTPQNYTSVYGASSYTSGVQQIVAGENHTCVLKNGLVACWGDNTYGVLSMGVMGGSSNTPNPVSSLSNATAIASSSHGSCAKVRGALYCWGTESFDPFSSSGGAGMSGPYGFVSGISTFALSDGHSCAMNKGAAECWGLNTNGEIGDGTTIDQQGNNTQVSGLTTGVQQVSVNATGSCAIVNGAIKCWGTGFGHTPQATSINSGAQNLYGNSANINNNTCAIINGGIQCWGDNSYGQLGNGTTSSSATTPVSVRPWL